MRKLAVLFALALGAAMVVGACSGSGSGSAAGLTGKTWQWTASTTKVPASQSVVPDPENYTLDFKSDGTFSAKVDCNQLSGTYTTDILGRPDDRARADDDGAVPGRLARHAVRPRPVDAPRATRSPTTS